MHATLRLPANLRTQLAEWVRAGYPCETCGLLVGRGGDGAREVERVTLACNLNFARAADRYELDPENFLAADGEARAAGLDIVGVWHSHPDHPARPSETDRAAAWSSWSYVILSVGREGVGEMRSWHLVGGRFEEEMIAP